MQKGDGGSGKKQSRGRKNGLKNDARCVIRHTDAFSDHQRTAVHQPSQHGASAIAARSVGVRSTLRWGSQRNAFDANPICHVTAIASPEEVCLA